MKGPHGNCVEGLGEQVWVHASHAPLPGGVACGRCTGERELEELLADLPGRWIPLEPPPARPAPADLPFAPGDWIRVGGRMGQLVRIGGRPGRRILRVRMADSLREERVVLHDGGPEVRRMGARR